MNNICSNYMSSLLKNDYNDNGRLKPSFKGNSPLALETINMLKKVPSPQRIEKQLVFEQDKHKSNLLDEKQLKE